MAHDEFDLISRYFGHIGKPAVGEVLLGIGDDGAVVNCSPNSVVISVDTLVSGVHFFADDPADSIAHKALMVNLSDLSAMGAVPFAFLLSLTLPSVDPKWLTLFSSTLHRVAVDNDVQLIGGDTTAGPLSVSVTALGSVKDMHVLKRSAARIGDDIYVTGELGTAAFYVYARSHEMPVSDRVLRAYRYPQLPVTLGSKLCALAHAAIDVSDGLIADLSHVLKASHVGARLVRADIPISKEWSVLPPDDAFLHAVTGGDDYVLCFTAPKSARGLLEILSTTSGARLTRIGEVFEGEGLYLDEKLWEGWAGYQHFS